MNEDSPTAEALGTELDDLGDGISEGDAGEALLVRDASVSGGAGSVGGQPAVAPPNATPGAGEAVDDSAMELDGTEDLFIGLSYNRFMRVLKSPGVSREIADGSMGACGLDSDDLPDVVKEAWAEVVI